MKVQSGHSVLICAFANGRQIFLEGVIRDDVTYTEHVKRKTVTSLDVVYALKRQGRTLYGFGWLSVFIHHLTTFLSTASSDTSYGMASSHLILANLGLLYADQGKIAETEAMILRALQGYEKGSGNATRHCHRVYAQRQGFPPGGEKRKIETCRYSAVAEIASVR